MLENESDRGNLLCCRIVIRKLLRDEGLFSFIGLWYESGRVSIANSVKFVFKLLKLSLMPN